MPELALYGLSGQRPPITGPTRRVSPATAALFLASRAGGFVTGQTIVVDGGTTITDGN